MENSKLKMENCKVKAENSKQKRVLWLGHAPGEGSWEMENGVWVGTVAWTGQSGTLSDAIVGHLTFVWANLNSANTHIAIAAVVIVSVFIFLLLLLLLLLSQFLLGLQQSTTRSLLNPLNVPNKHSTELCPSTTSKYPDKYDRLRIYVPHFVA